MSRASSTSRTASGIRSGTRPPNPTKLMMNVNVLSTCVYGCLLCDRWKGENVATTEVADILIMVDFIEEANVYGVKVPGMEKSDYFLTHSLSTVSGEIHPLH